jgi:hypothetical protein
LFHVARRELEQKSWKEISQNSFGVTYTIKIGIWNFAIVENTIVLEGGVIDLHIGTLGGIDSSALKVACSPPGHGKNFRNFLKPKTDVHGSHSMFVHHCSHCLKSNVRNCLHSLLELSSRNLRIVSP